MMMSDCRQCVIVVTVLLILEIVAGQTYNLSGSGPYGVRGGDYKFTCKISGGNFILTDIQFSRDHISACGQLLTCRHGSPSDTRYTCGCINGNNSTLYLNITNVTSTDTGTWTCGDIFNPGSSSPVTLLVYYGPENIEFTPVSSSITVIENESTTVTCSADCNPPPCNINWFKGSTIISSTELLLLNNITRQKAGNYTCQVTNTQIPDSLQSKQLLVKIYNTDVNGCNNMLGVGIAIGLVISVLIVGIAAALAWVILKRKGKRFCIKSVRANDQTVDNGTTNQGLNNNTMSETRRVTANQGLVNNIFSDTPPIVTNTRGVNREHINTPRASSTYESPNSEDYLTAVNTYEELDKQTMDQQPNTYQELSLYQNLAEVEK
ncbi:uncharacterized protein LOC126829922 [Patella vulgata]|uniref:uncharacterized protein LOC126829922 n=1 Tax=Patella vulgata TaxID=6465 RepID=UPI002180386F|nr:uncharacterized protein LOC126829922 [Patella vulgata]